MCQDQYCRGKAENNRGPQKPKLFIKKDWKWHTGAVRADNGNMKSRSNSQRKPGHSSQRDGDQGLVATY